MFTSRFSSNVGHVGVDIGEHDIRLSQVREHNGELELIGAGLVSMPRLAGEQHAKMSQLTDQLRGALASGGFAGRRCVIALPRQAVQVQSVRMPRMEEHELRQAVQWEAAERFQVDREKVEVDFIRTGGTAQGQDEREEVLIIAAVHEELERWLGLVLDAGLRPIAVETDFTALARVYSRHYRRESDRQNVRAVVQVGCSGSTALVLRGNEIALCKPIDIGGDDLSRSVAEHLQLDLVAAKELRASRISARMAKEQDQRPPTDARPLDPPTERAVFDAVRPLLGQLVKEVMLCLRYFGVTFRGHTPTCVILTGPHGMEPNLDAMMSQMCKLDVTFGDPNDGLERLADDIHRSLNRAPGPIASWAVATGLSLRGCQNREQDDHGASSILSMFRKEAA